MFFVPWVWSSLQIWYPLILWRIDPKHKTGKHGGHTNNQDECPEWTIHILPPYRLLFTRGNRPVSQCVLRVFQIIASQLSVGSPQRSSSNWGELPHPNHSAAALVVNLNEVMSQGGIPVRVEVTTRYFQQDLSSRIITQQAPCMGSQIWGVLYVRSSTYLGKNENVSNNYFPFCILSICDSWWPSRPRRCVQLAVGYSGRGFESHFWQLGGSSFTLHLGVLKQ